MTERKPFGNEPDKAQRAGATLLVDPTRRDSSGAATREDPIPILHTAPSIFAEPPRPSHPTQLIERRSMVVAIHEVRTVEGPAMEARVAPMPIMGVAEPSPSQVFAGLTPDNGLAEHSRWSSTLMGLEARKLAAEAEDRESRQGARPVAERDLSGEAEARAIVRAPLPEALAVRALSAGPLARDARLAPARSSALDAECDEESLNHPVNVTAVEAGATADRIALAMLDEPGSARAEQFRLLRHRLQAAQAPRCIAVAAPREGEEAANCAVELALAYAEAGTGKVLLTELDTRQPRLAQALGLEVDKCFAQQLSERFTGGAQPWHALSALRENLHILPIAPGGSATRRIHTETLKEALSDFARVGYGQVIVACPKLLDSADVALFAGTIEGALLTGPVGKTTAGDLRNAAKALQPTAVVGVVLLEG